MILGKIVGTVVATRKHEALVGSKIQIVQVVNPDESVVENQRFVAIDTVGGRAWRAGHGNHRYQCRQSSG